MLKRALIGGMRSLQPKWRSSSLTASQSTATGLMVNLPT